MARCVEDYTKYSTFPYSLFYKNELRFKGHRIHVTRAPEPDEIIWENLEISRFTKRFRRFRTSLLSFILLIIGFIVILQTVVQVNLVKQLLPDLLLCDVEVSQYI